MIAVAGAVGPARGEPGRVAGGQGGFDRPASDVWTLPDQVQVVGARADPVGRPDARAAGQGAVARRSQLATVGKALGVTGALFIGERVAATSAATRPTSRRRCARPGALPDGTDAGATGRARLLVRVARTGEGATAARLAWLVPITISSSAPGLLLFLVWFAGPARRADVS